MVIKSRTKWQDHAEGPKHTPLTRRDFIRRGMAVGTLSVALPEMFGSHFLSQANADMSLCQVPSKQPGAIAQVYSSGGPTMGARFFSDMQAESMNPTMASHYGISGLPGNLKKLGPNMWIDVTSTFGATLMAGPPGFQGGATQWQNTVLKSISAGGHLGPFNADDGAGDSGLYGSVSLDKGSLLGKDIYHGSICKHALWTAGTPAATVSLYPISPSATNNYTGSLNPTTLKAPFTLIPAASGYTTNTKMQQAADGASSIATALSKIFKTTARKGGNGMFTSAQCSFYGNAALTDPMFASNYFDLANPNLAALSKVMSVGDLNSQEAAFAAAYYQSACGVVGGVIAQLGGRDYHGTDPATVIAPADTEDARTIVMFLAACYAAQQPGALIYNSNGQAIADSTVPVTMTVNGAPLASNCPVAKGDAGGVYNGGLIIFYHPQGLFPKSPRYTGLNPGLNTTTGAVVADLAVAGYANAFAGLYLTAHKYLSKDGSFPEKLLARLKPLNIAPNPDAVCLIPD